MREFSPCSLRVGATATLTLMFSVLWPAETAHAQSTLKRCEPDVTVVHHANGFCGSPIPPLPAGFVAERLHNCGTVANLSGLGMTDGVPLQQRLETTFVITKQCGGSPCTISSTELGLLESYGYGEAEPSCGIAAQGKTQAVVETTEAPRLGDYAQLTGATDAVPEAAALLCQPDMKCPRTRVAVLDSGVDALALPETGGNILTWAAPGLCSPNDLPCEQEDLLGHGTAVADVMLRSAGGLLELVSIKVLDETGSGTMRDLARGVLVAAGDFEASLLNLSLAWAGGSRAGEAMPVYMAEALSAVYQHGARVVAAGGNRTHIDNATYQYFYPAAAAVQQDDLPLGIVAVGGLNSTRGASTQSVGQLKSSFPIDIWAPSENICSRTSRYAYESGNMRVSGTSLAAPQVTGTLALLLTLARELGDPGTLAQETAHPLDGLLPLLTTGSDRRMNVCQAVNTVLGTDTGCMVKSSMNAGAPDGCELTMRAQAGEVGPLTFQSNIQMSGYTASSGITRSGMTIKPLDQTTNTTWSAQVSSAPAIPVCTSCDYCPSLANLRVGWANAGYGNYQLRLTVNGAYVYYSLSALNTMMSSYSNSFGPVPIQTQFGFSSLLNYSSATEPWIIAQELSSGAWSAQPLKPGC